MPDVALPFPQESNLPNINVKARDRKSAPAEFDHQRESYITHADYADFCGIGFDFS